MQIAHEPDDAAEFIAAVTQVVDGLVRQTAPSSLILIKVDNWFGSKWLGFSGKLLGALAVRKSVLTVPPFVPNRIISQRRFTAPLYDETDPGKSLHINVPSSVALGRKIADAAPGAAVVWYGGNTKQSSRGSIMTYIPEQGSYRSWYAGFSNREAWQVIETIGIKRDDLLRLMPSTLTTAS